MIEGILIGLTTALTFQNIFMVMIGCFFGTCLLYTSDAADE